MNNPDSLNDLFSASNNDLMCNYYTTHEFNILYPQNDEQNFSVFHCNIRSINANGDDLINYLETINHKFDLICLSETWSKDIQFLNSFFPSYFGFHTTRPVDKRGGGVSIFIKTKFKARKIFIPNCNTDYFEGIFVHFSVKDKNFNIGCIYRPLTVIMNNLSKFLKIFANNSCNMKGDVILVGDFNYDQLKIHFDSSCSDFFDSAYSCSLVPVISRPTRHNNDSFSLLDNIFVTKLTNFTSGILTFDVTDHLPVFVVYDKIFQDTLSDYVHVTYKILNDRNLETMFCELRKENFDHFYQLNVDERFRKLDDIIYKHYDKACLSNQKILALKIVINLGLIIS